MSTIESLQREAEAILGAYREQKATPEQLARLPKLNEELEAEQKNAAQAERGLELLGKLGTPGGAKSANEGQGEAEAKSLGEHLARHLKVAGIKSAGGQFAFSTPEYKAATDPLATAANLLEPDVQQRVIPLDAWRPTIASLFAQGSISGTSLKYFRETPVEGDFEAVAELGHKPQLSMGYEPVTEGLAKLAGFIKESDEFLEDLGFLASVTNGRLLRKLAQHEEFQLMSGSGTAPNLRGLLNRTGLQTKTAATVDQNTDVLFSAAMSVQNVTGLVADGLVINPADYELQRLAKDGNGQYLGGGPFTGQYGVGGITMQPPLWGIPTVVSSAVPVGTAVVGAFGTAAMLFRKGGVRVEIANQNSDDFEYNRITIRAEERLGLAVYRPDAFVRVTLAQPAVTP